MADLNNAWDAEDFEPEVPGTKPEGGDQWAGEDSKAANKKILAAKEEEVKKDQPETQAYQRPKKKPVGEKIAEKEARQRKEQEDKKQKHREEMREMTPEQRQAEKERIRKIQAQGNLSLAKGLFD